jgi:hypothetical protein
VANQFGFVHIFMLAANIMGIYEQTKVLDTVLEEYSSIVKKYYPNIISDGMGYSGPNFHYRFSVQFRDYKQTPFYYDGENKFVHWTSLSSLSSIINNNEIRLYNLDNSEDKEEFNYAGNLLSLTDDQISIIKQNYFTTSFCSIDNLKDDFLWRKYGRNYEGVAIVFSLVDDSKDWKNFFLSKVYYDLDPTFKNFQDEIEQLRRKYNNGATFMTDIWRFAGFYKKTHFQTEKEIRLACIFPFESQVDILKYVRKELKIDPGRNRIVRYIPLKLWIDPNSSFFKTLDIDQVTQNTFDYVKPGLPKIKIDSIYVGKGCGLSENEYWSVHNKLKEMFEWRLGYPIELPLNLYDPDI